MLCNYAVASGYAVANGYAVNCSYAVDKDYAVDGDYAVSPLYAVAHSYAVSLVQAAGGTVVNDLFGQVGVLVVDSPRLAVRQLDAQLRGRGRGRLGLRRPGRSWSRRGSRWAWTGAVGGPDREPAVGDADDPGARGPRGPGGLARGRRRHPRHGDRRAPSRLRRRRAPRRHDERRLLSRPQLDPLHAERARRGNARPVHRQRVPRHARRRDRRRAGERARRRRRRAERHARPDQGLRRERHVLRARGHRRDHVRRRPEARRHQHELLRRRRRVPGVDGVQVPGRPDAEGVPAVGRAGDLVRAEARRRPRRRSRQLRRRPREPAFGQRRARSFRRRARA